MPKKRKDGYLRIKFTVDGKQYEVYAKTMKEAKEKELVKRQQIADKIYQKGKGLTYNAYFERWHDNRRDKVAGQTLRQEVVFHKALSDTPIDKAGTKFGKLKLTEIERQNIFDLQRALLEAVKDDGSRRFGTRSINGMISLVNHVLSDALTDRIITWNPAKGVKPVKRTEPKARDTIHRALTEEETRTFIEASAADWYAPLFRFLLSSGCRIGEAGALKVSAVRGGKVFINGTVTRSEFGGYEIGDTAKTVAGVRSIPYTRDIKDAVEAQRAANNIKFGNVQSMDGCIFKAPEGGILRESRVNASIAKICKRAGIEKFTAHAFRDTFATRAIESGMNPKTLQEILGHSDIGMTMNLYAHVMENTKENEMQRVNLGISAI